MKVIIISFIIDIITVIQMRSEKGFKCNIKAGQGRVI